ncbi:MAG: hypothetical protein ACTSWR_05550 [Candidatus Helarchaeota archaeon]
MKININLEIISVVLLPIGVYTIWSIIFYFYSPLIPVKDAFYYKMMSETPFNPSISAPYCYRILTPLIVFILPFDSGSSFLYINFIFFILTSIIFYKFLKRLNFNKFYSFNGEIIFTAGNVTSIYLIHNFIMVDQLNQLIFLIGCYLLVFYNPDKRIYRDILIIVILAIGVLNKETILLIIPIYFVLESGNLFKKIFKTLLIATPSLGIFIVLRLFIPHTGSYEAIWLFYHLENLLSTLYNIFLTFGLFWIMAFFNFDNNIKFLQRSYWIIPIFIGQIILASNIYRLIFLSFPIVLPLALLEFKQISQKINKVTITFILTSQITITIFYILKKYLTWDFLNIFYFPLIAISSLIVLVISAYFYFKE